MIKMKWTTEKIWEVALRYDNLSKFIAEQNRCYHAAIRRKINKEITQHMESIYFWNFDLAVAEAKKYASRSEFHEGSPGAVAWAQRHGRLQEVLDAAGLDSKKAINGSWTKAKVLAVAKSCSSKNDFRYNHNNVYAIAKRDGYMRECNKFWVAPRTYWTNKMLAAEAKKYRTKIDFMLGNNSAYAICRKRQIIDKVCAHMEDAGGSDNNVVYIWRSDFQFNGLHVVKVGVTSERCGDRRVKDVSRKASCKAEIIILQKVSIRATEVETVLKKIGQDPLLEKFDGSTEFRAMTIDEIDLAVDIIKQAA